GAGGGRRGGGGGRGAATARGRLARDGLERGQEHRLRNPRGTRDQVDAVVHAVDEIDVRVPGWAVHDLVPRRAVAAVAVGRAVARSAVRFHLDDAARGATLGRVVNQHLPEQCPGDAQGGGPVELPRQGPPAHAFSFFTSSVSSGTALKRSATRP